MELRRYVAILWRWSWLLILGTALAATTAYLVSKGQTKIYEATATVLVNEARGTGGAEYQGIVANQQLAKTYANLVPSRPILDQVAKNLNLAPRDLGTVSATVVRETQLIQIRNRHRDPRIAAAVANEAAKVFGEQIRDAQGIEQGAQEQELQNQINAVQGSIEQANAELARLGGRPPGLPEDQRQNQVAQATARLDSLRANLQGLQRQLQDLRISVAKSFNSVKLAEPAVAPLAPIKPRPGLNAILAGVVGLLVAAAVVAVIEYLDDTVKTPEDVQRAVAAPALGAIARFGPQGGMAGKARGRRKVVPRLLTGLDARSPIAEAYRMVRTNLEFARSGRPNRTMLITSSSPGEGKSTTAANLALVLAQTGRRVLLVDADMRRPSLHQLFDAPNTVGLSTLFVMEEPAIEGFLRMTPLDNLLLLPSGPLPPNPAELLSSARMGQILDLLREQADIVLVDSPPLLGVADAAALAGQLDGVILVVDSGRTRAAALAHCAEVLGRAHATLWGVVLNKLTARRGEGYYYYYYSYRYYGADTAPQSSRAAPSRPVAARPAEPWTPPDAGSGNGNGSGAHVVRAHVDEPRP